MKTIIEEKPEYILYHHTGITRFTGCQCIKDCTCAEDFIPGSYNYYSVKKRVNSFKTTIHNNINDAKERITLILSLPKNRLLT